MRGFAIPSKMSCKPGIHELRNAEISNHAEQRYVLKPEIFKQNPSEFKNKIIILKPIENPSFHKQPCET